MTPLMYTRRVNYHDKHNKINSYEFISFTELHQFSIIHFYLTDRWDQRTIWAEFLFFFILIETSLEKVVVQYPNILKFL